MSDQVSGRVMAGAILVVAGLGLFALQFLEGLGDSVTLFFIGVLFLAGYLYRRAYGLLVPAGILMGIGLGSVGEAAFFSLEGMSNIGLGIGFLSVFLIDYAYQGRSHWWPLIPGSILLLTGLVSSSRALRTLFEIGWPLLLVLAGLFLLFGASLIGRR